MACLRITVFSNWREQTTDMLFTTSRASHPALSVREHIIEHDPWKDQMFLFKGLGFIRSKTSTLFWSRKNELSKNDQLQFLVSPESWFSSIDLIWLRTMLCNELIYGSLSDWVLFPKKSVKCMPHLTISSAYLYSFGIKIQKYTSVWYSIKKPDISVGVCIWINGPCFLMLLNWYTYLTFCDPIG